MSQDLPVTSYALLGLLGFGDPVTGYELKQRADRTMRFYWTSPAMSQVYSELDRLHRHGLVRTTGAGRGTSYSLSARGRKALHAWLTQTPGFPVLKHPVALRLMHSAHTAPEETVAMLRAHLEAVVAERAALAEVRASLEGRDAPGGAYYYPSLVAEWGLDYLETEERTVRRLLDRLAADHPEAPETPEDAEGAGHPPQ